MSKASIPKTSAGRVSKPPFCASCCAETSSLVPRGIGKGDGIVWLCSTCDAEHPRSGRYGYGGKEHPARGFTLFGGNRRSGPQGAPGKG